MTKQESFKRRVRERMEKTGERYGAARRALLGGFADDATTDNSTRTSGRVRVSQPEAALRASIVDDNDRQELFPGLDTALRWNAGSSTGPIGWPPSTTLRTRSWSNVVGKRMAGTSEI